MTPAPATRDRLRRHPAVVAARACSRPRRARCRRSSSLAHDLRDRRASRASPPGSSAPAGCAALRQPWRVWALGIGGLFGYHALYFTALQARAAGRSRADQLSLAAADRAVLGRCCRAKRLRAGHIAGAVLGLCGVAALFVGRGGLHFAPGAMPGYLCRLRLRLRLGGLLGPVPPGRRGADRCGGGLLPRHGRARASSATSSSNGPSGPQTRCSGSPSWPSGSARSVPRSISGMSA